MTTCPCAARACTARRCWACWSNCRGWPREVAAQMLLIAQPGASTAADAAHRRAVPGLGRAFRTVPRLDDVVAGRAQFNEIKKVAIEDLLGRDSVELDWTAIRTGISGRTVLVTGGGGSIGSELCRQVARLGAGALIVRRELRIQPLPHRARAAPRSIRTWCCTACLLDAGDRDGVRHVLRTAPPADRVPCRGLQARAVAAGAGARGGAQQRPGTPAWWPRRPRPRLRALRADLHRQGGQPDQRDGRVQARGRDPVPELLAPAPGTPISSPCASATCSIRPARWCRCSASRSARAARSRSPIRRSPAIS